MSQPTPEPMPNNPMPNNPMPEPVAPGPSPAPWSKAAGAAATPWAQRRGPVRPHATARLRKTIEGLPEWEPLPPGETFVQRGRGDL